MTISNKTSAKDPFEPSRTRFETLLDIVEKTKVSHYELETLIQAQGQELLRQLFQDKLNLEAMCEPRLDDVVDAQGVPRKSIECNHERPLTTVFGKVTVRRFAYRKRYHINLYPADAVLNLPTEEYSHGLRRLAAIESSRGSFGDAIKAIKRSTGVHVGKRQVEELAQRASADFDSFYAGSPRPKIEPGDALVLSADGKGIVMRTDALRQPTAKAAQSSEPATRLSGGEKRNYKRMAEVGAVYAITPAPRTPQDVLSTNDKTAGQTKPAPVAKDKWLVASVVEDARTVISQVFNEAQRRDPQHLRPWVVLVDGNNHQIDCINAEAKARKVNVNIVIDFIHVLEYLWKAAHSFFAVRDPAAEAWVADKAAAVLAGEAGIVAGSIARKATCLQLDFAKREGADKCHDYLMNKRPYLNYHIALEQGWPIATGIIEGACKTLVKDRFDITGARWGLDGAEAILKLRALCKNDDFDAYWDYHLAQERRRVHEDLYANGVIPGAA